MWTFAVKFVFAKYGEKFINGQKIRRRCEVGFAESIFLTVLCGVIEKNA